MVYFGNDTYEPLGYNLPDGSINPNAINTNYTDTYTGRFFSDYDENWNFANPDVQTLPGSNLTLRQAYQKYTLPYWHIRFVCDATTNNLKCYVNGMLYLDEDMFDAEDDYQYVEGEAITINALQMHVLNYGTGQQDAPNTPRESYKGVFTFPRITKLA